MADVTTIVPGIMEDHLGRQLHPQTEARMVAMEDGKSVETKIAELLAELAKYVPLSGGGTINGSLEVKNGYLTLSQWGQFSAGTDGFAMFAQNAYKNQNANTYHFANTHESLGAKGIIFRHGSPGVYWFDTGMIPTVKDEAFVPDFKRLDKPDAELISGQDLNTLTQNGVYCGQQLGNSPDNDWWYVWVQNLTNNSSSYVCQIVSGVNRMAMYFRIKLNGTWQGWAQLFTANGGNISGTVTIFGNGGDGLQLVGGNHVYVPIFKNGVAGGRTGYFGYPDGAATAFEINNEIPGGTMRLKAQGGVYVNDQKIPTQYAATWAPGSSDGQDGDVWDVYV